MRTDTENQPESQNPNEGTSCPHCGQLVDPDYTSELLDEIPAILGKLAFIQQMLNAHETALYALEDMACAGQRPQPSKIHALLCAAMEEQADATLKIRADLA